MNRALVIQTLSHSDTQNQTMYGKSHQTRRYEVRKGTYISLNTPSKTNHRMCFELMFISIIYILLYFNENKKKCVIQTSVTNRQTKQPCHINLSYQVVLANFPT